MNKEGFIGSGQQKIRTVADHYGIYRDLFCDAYFYPQMLLGVGYNVEGEEEMVNPVFTGNILSPAEVGLPSFYILPSVLNNILNELP